MAACFSAFDHPIYQCLISNHIVDVLHMPKPLLAFFMQGGFVVSRHFHSVGIDEAHEMLINKQTKQAIVRPSKDYIDRISRYIPYRMKSLSNLKQKLFPEEMSVRLASIYIHYCSKCH